MTMPGQGVPIAPVPTVVATQQVQGPDGKGWVLAQFSTPTGVGAFFFEPQAAIEVGKQLERIGQAAKAGLFLPGPGPNGNGGKR